MPLPTDTEHHAIFGQNGSGKTVFGLWQLAQRNFDRKPWVIIDFKRDPLIAQIPRIEPIGFSVPRQKGLYVVRPSPADVDDGEVTEWLYDVWERENVGLFIDEGYMFNPRDRALRAVLTQGRSKHIPIIALSQRPSWISPFILSEASHISVFYLQMPQDIQRVREFVPGVNPSALPPHHSFYSYMKQREVHNLGPCPDENEILDMFDRKRVRRGFLWGAL